MKKLTILLGLMLSLNINAVQAMSVTSQPTAVMINGVSLLRNDIQHTDFCATTGVTTIYLHSGATITFHTNYNEYSQISSAIYQQTNVAPQPYQAAATYAAPTTYVQPTYVAQPVYYSSPYHCYSPYPFNFSVVLGHHCFYHRPCLRFGII